MKPEVSKLRVFVHLPISVFLQHSTYAVTNGSVREIQMRIHIHSKLFHKKWNAEVRIGNFLAVEFDPGQFSFL